MDRNRFDIVTWLHVVPHGDDYEAQHREYLQFYENDSHNFIVLKNETYHHPRKGTRARRYMWACAMTGTHTLEAYLHPRQLAFAAGLEADDRLVPQLLTRMHKRLLDLLTASPTGLTLATDQSQRWLHEAQEALQKLQVSVFPLEIGIQ